MQISPDDAERFAKMAEVLADKIRTAKKMPISETGECVLNGQRVVITLVAEIKGSTFDEIIGGYGHTDMRT